MKTKILCRVTAPFILAGMMLTTACSLSTRADTAAPLAATSAATALSADAAALYDAVAWPELDLPDVSDALTGGTEVVLTDSSVTLSQAGTYHVTGSLSDGQLIVDASKNDDIRIILDNASISCSYGPALQILSADRTTVTLTGDNALTDGSYDTTDEAGAALYSKDDLVLNGSGSLTVNGNCQHGILCKDDLVITGGSYTVNAVQDAIRGVDSLTVTDGTFRLTSGEDALKTSQDEDETCGWMLITGGSFAISAGDDAVHAETQLRITDGDFDIATCYEGLEGQNISIEGGSIRLYATDDGVNAASAGSSEAADRPTDRMSFDAAAAPTGSDTLPEGEELTEKPAFAEGEAMQKPSGMGGMGGESGNSLLAILGGTLIVDADGDGLDSNGSLLLAGGTVTVNGPSDGGNGALDYDSKFLATGGTLVATGYSTMAQGTDADSPQPGLLVNTETVYDAATVLTLRDADGNILLTDAPTKSFNSVCITCPALTDGATYTLYCGDEAVAELTLDGGLTTSGNVGGMGGMGGGRGNRGEMNGTRPTRPDDAQAGATPTQPDRTESDGAVDGAANGEDPGEAGGVAPGEAGEAVPGETGGVAPGEAGGVAPGEAGEAVPGETGGVAPGETGGVAPGEAGGVAPGEAGNGADTTTESLSSL